MSEEEFIGYCVKCYASRIVVRDVTDGVTVKGEHVMTGRCPVCGIPIRRVIGVGP